jgi:WbqC-like protein family.
MKSVWLTTAYLAPIEYYTKLLAYDRVFIEQHDHYMKETYRNRCRICGPDGVITLTVPVVKPETPKAEIKDIRISDHGNWRHLHWNAIESAYNATPYFEFYRDYFQPFYEKDYIYLLDFNDELSRLVCDLIDMQPHICHTEEYIKSFSEGEYDFRDIIHPKKDFQIVDTEFRPNPYYQVFHEKLGFISNLSIIDMLFNCGPESLILLRS